MPSSGGTGWQNFMIRWLAFLISPIIIKYFLYQWSFTDPDKTVNSILTSCILSKSNQGSVLFFQSQTKGLCYSCLKKWMQQPLRFNSNHKRANKDAFCYLMKMSMEEKVGSQPLRAYLRSNRRHFKFCQSYIATSGHQIWKFSKCTISSKSP